MTLLDLFKKCDYNGGPWVTIGDDTQYRIEQADGMQYLFFQASNSNKDWEYNFKPWVEPYRGCGWKCHAGYANVWKQCNDAIFAMLDKSKPLTIAGYSHGADLAILAHEDAIWRGYTPYTTTFGASAIVSGDFKNVFKLLGRVYVRGDIVTTVWPWFRHVGEAIPLGKWAFPSPLKHRQVEYIKGLS